MKYLLPAFLMLLSVPAFAAAAGSKPVAAGRNEPVAVSHAEPRQCPNNRKLVSVCSAVATKAKDKSPYQYHYERLIYDSACVDYEHDSDAEISRKVNLMWNKYEKDIKCNSSQYNFTNGSFLKVAVNSMFREVLEDAAQVWKVNLNRVDENDNMTVLDYVSGEIERLKGSAAEPTLRNYYGILRKGGAKHRSELENPATNP